MSWFSGTRAWLGNFLLFDSRGKHAIWNSIWLTIICQQRLLKEQRNRKWIPFQSGRRSNNYSRTLQQLQKDSSPAIVRVLWLDKTLHLRLHSLLTDCRYLLLATASARVTRVSSTTVVVGASVVIGIVVASVVVGICGKKEREQNLDVRHHPKIQWFVNDAFSFFRLALLEHSRTYNDTRIRNYCWSLRECCSCFLGC